MDKNKMAFSLVEVLIAVVIMALIMTGLTNVFLAVKRHTIHSRSRIQTVELGKYFLAPLQVDVDQSEWNSSANDYNSPNKLQKGTRSDTAQTLNNISYSPSYEVSVPPGFSSTSPMRKVKVTISWTEPSVP